MSDESLEQLVFECLERLERDGSAGIEEVCEENAELADAVRGALERLGVLGLRERPAAALGAGGSLGPYRLIQPLGAGGMGVVYAAEQQPLGRRVALKLLRPDSYLVPGSLERFRREARTAANLQHPGIVTVHDFGEVDGVAFIAMELVDGPSVARSLAGLSPRLPSGARGRAFLSAEDGESGVFRGSWWSICALLVRQVADALDHAHSRGVVHRDVKPSNLFLAKTGRILLGDFGLARELGSTRLTASTDRPGSLAYMAPEVLSGESRDDPRQDIYSLGVTFYEMLTLALPFDGAERESMRGAILAGRVTAPRRRDPALPRDVETVCLKAMAHSPRDRYRTAADFAADLESLLEGRPISARRFGPLSRLARWTSRRPRTVAAVALACVILPAAFAWRENRARNLIAQREQRTARERDLKEAALRDVRRLADTLLVQDLLEKERDLGPAEPERVAGEGGFEAWSESADDVLRRLDDHIAAFARVRERATERPADAAAPAPECLRLAELLSRRAALARSAASGRAAELKELDASIQGVRASLFDTDVWSFPDTTDRWLHHALAELIELSVDLEVLARRVRERTAFARRVDVLTIDDHRDAWAAVIRGAADRAENPRYGGLRLEPQRGLVPVGADPDSELFEFAVLETGTVPRRQRDGCLDIDVESAVVLVLVPGGSFTMGAERRGGANRDSWARPTEGPCHIVALEPFFISKYEMSQAQWIRATGENPSFYREGMRIGGRFATAVHPIEQIDRRTTARVLERLGLEIPTEAQWEFACRAGSDEIWWTGNDRESLDGVANLADSFARENGGDPGLSYEDWLDDGHTFHAPIGSFEANGFGLHDMTGNVWEWCRDARLDYANNTPRAGDGLRHFDDLAQVVSIIRGGSFADSALYARSAARSNTAPARSAQSLGVRPSRRLRR